MEVCKIVICVVMKLKLSIIIIESSGDISFGGNLTFSMGSAINSMECVDVEVEDDDILESIEEFTVYVSNFFTLVESFDGGEAVSNGMEEVNAELIFTVMVFPCENTSIIIDTSETEGEFMGLKPLILHLSS